MQTTAWRLATNLCVLGALVVGCIGTDGGATPTTTGGTESTPTSGTADDGGSDEGTSPSDPMQPPVEDIDCPFTPPPDVSIDCSTVTVPENWETGDGEVVLTVARLPSRNGGASSPVVYFEGGPGGHALDALQFTFADLWDPLLDDYDLIFFDQRGTGYSVPRLDCTGLTELSRLAEDDPELTPEQVDELFIGELGECAEMFRAGGIDLSQYNTVSNARDADAIRRSFGYDEWNILGISYGTKLALEVLRQYPETVRAAVIDSVYPPQVDAIKDTPSTFLASLDAVSSACAAEPACAAEGDLKERLIAAAQELEAEPRQVEVTNYLTGETDTVQATGDAIVALVALGLYTPFSFTDWPELLTDIEDGGTAALSTYLSLERTNEPLFTVAMHYAVQCHEEISFADPAEVSTAAPEDPFGLYDIAFDPVDPFAACEAVDAGRAEAVSNQAVVSDVPTLVLAGEFDPVTPPAWGELAGETLSRSQFAVLSGESHRVSSSECGVQLVQQFLAAPTDAIDTSCAGEGAAFFLTEPETAIEMERTVADFGLGATSVLQPAGWSNQNVNGVLDSTRQNGILDVTELLQFAGPSLIASSVEFFVAGQLDIELGDPAEIDVGGVTWDVRSGDNGRTSADIYRREVEGGVHFVLLIAAADERDDLVESVLLPAVEGFGSE